MAMTHEHPVATVPPRLFDDPAAERRWRGRFTAPRLSLPEPARDEPDHTVLVSNQTGTFELFTWNAATGELVQATDRPDGTSLGSLSADGRSLWWFDDHGGDEFGSWRHQMFGAGPDSGHDALPGVPPGYPAGVEIGRTLAIAGFSDDDGTRVHLAKDGGIATVYRNAADGGVGALSTDESLWVLSHSERGDSRYPALRVFDVGSGEVVCDLDDGSGKGLVALGFPTVAGDSRLLVGHERRGRDELGIWDIRTGAFTELRIDLPGDLDGGFYPDGTAVLVVHTYQGRSTLHRFDLASNLLTRLLAETGVIAGALARADGTVWYRHSSAETPWQLRALRAGAEAHESTDHAEETGAAAAASAPPAAEIGRSTVLLTGPGEAAAPSEPLIDLWVDGPGGKIHAFLARPTEAPAVSGAAHSNSPVATVFVIHGGPADADEDGFDALRAAYLDAGLAVCHVNYRGSTGYGSAWRDAIGKRVGHTELADIAAVQDHLAIRGLIDPDRCAIAGHSWGGFLTLLALGTQPSRWACGVAGVPVADYLTAYADEMEPMRAYDRALFGGSPDEKPGGYADSSPLTWIDAVAAPVLVMVGENDPRCPVRQVDNYLAALADAGGAYAVYRFNAGHGSMVVEERLRQVACEVAFVRDHLAG